jgi:hypothetical protein
MIRDNRLEGGAAFRKRERGAQRVKRLARGQLNKGLVQRIDLEQGSVEVDNERNIGRGLQRLVHARSASSFNLLFSYGHRHRFHSNSCARPALEVRKVKVTPKFALL